MLYFNELHEKMTQGEAEHTTYTKNERKKK